MKKLLISIITILLLVLLILTTIKGISIGKLNILGIKQIKQQDEDLNTLIGEATDLVSKDYKESKSRVEESANELENKKKEYEDLVMTSTDSEIQNANQTYFYDIDMLWTRIGNHAKREGVSIDIVLKNIREFDSKNSTSDVDKKYVCDMAITAKGSYVGIEEFITDIEDDSELGFKIEDFVMTPASAESSAENNTTNSTNTTSTEKSSNKSNNSGNVVEASFNCKTIKVRGISSSYTATDNATTGNSETTTSTPTEVNNSKGANKANSSSKSSKSNTTNKDTNKTTSKDTKDNTTKKENTTNKTK